VESAYHDVHGKVQAIVDKTTKAYEIDEKHYQEAKETFTNTWSRTVPPGKAKHLEAKLKKKAKELNIKQKGQQIAEAELRSIQEVMAALHQEDALADVWAALRAKEQQEVEGSEGEEGGEEKQDMEVSATQQALPPSSFFGRFTAALFGGSA
jgi:hypothetical protein